MEKERLMLQEISRRPHPCAPWTGLSDDLQAKLFPGGIGFSPELLQHRWEHLQARTFVPVEVPATTFAGFSASSQAALQKALSGKFPVVLTGQQPVVLGGPFFVWLKAAGAILAARRASRLLGCEVVPLFWIAGDDSDLPEVRALRNPISRQNLSLDFGDIPTGTPVGNLAPPPAEVARAAAEISNWWPGSPAIPLLSQAKTLSDLTRICLEAWFPNSGLAIVDAAWPGLRCSFAPAYADFATHARELSLDLAAGIQAAREAGLPVTLRALEGKARLFSLASGTRTRILTPEAPAALAAQVLAAPEQFSHDAASRIFAAEEAFPTLAHVLGPGEFAYVACLGEAQRRLSRPIAPALPRPSLTLLPSGTASLAREAGYELTQACPPTSAPFREAYLRGVHPELATLEGRWKALRGAYLSQVGGRIDSGPARRLEAWEGRELRHRMEALAGNHADKLRELEELWAWLGAGGLQERSWSPWALAHHLGAEVLDRLSEQLEGLDGTCHTILEVA